MKDYIKYVEDRNKLIEYYQLKLEDERKRLIEAPNSLAIKLGLSYGDEVILHLLDYRNDSIHCVQFEREIECIFNQLFLSNISSYSNEIFFVPSIYTKTTKGRVRKRPTYFPPSLNWRLLDKNRNLLLEHTAEQVIIEGTYKVGQLEEYRERNLREYNESN